MELKIPAGDFRAYLFDCDGTVADSMPLHYAAWSQALAKWNCEYPEKLFYAWGGRPVREIIARLNQMHNLQMPIEEAGDYKERLYLQMLPQLKAIPEVLAIIHAQHGRIPFAMVSGGRRDSVEGALKVLGLLEKFAAVVTADDYKRGKPAPDAYLMAAERLGVEPHDCLVFEDTKLGIEAAAAAGMASVFVDSKPKFD